MKQILTELKEEETSSTMIGGEFNTPLSAIRGTSTHKTNKEIRGLE